MQIFGNVVSYGLAAGAALCLSVSFTRLAAHARESRKKRG
jgi:hypothetical protein